MRLLTSFAVLVFLSFSAAPAAAQDVASFYKGKTVRIVVGFSAGGGYDHYARVLTRHIGRHIPGNPSVIVQNMPGASGLRAVNYLYNGAPRDGTVIAGVHNGIPTAPFEEPKQARFDVNELSWIGSISEDPFVGYVWHGAPVQMMQLKHGIFDEATISVIASDTVREIARAAGRSLDVRRFRPNVVVHLLRPVPFQEDDWLDGVLSFGEEDNAPAIAVTLRDERCSMLNLDPDSAESAPEVLKAVVRANRNNAGIYGTVIRIGRLAVGQTIFLRAAAEKKRR